jgi:membrane fusion protein (multidrug efflux system)
MIRMRLNVFRLAVLVFVVLGAGVLSGCNRAASEPTLPPEVPVSVQVTHLKRGAIARSIALPSLSLRPYLEATLYAKVAGYLKTIAVDKGDSVKEGQLLAEIEVPEMAADLAKYRAELEVADIDYRRLRDARKTAPDLVVVQSVDTAKARFDVAKANLDRLETLIGFARITAPFSGVITRRLVDPGAFIPAATSSSAAQSAAMVTVTDLSRIRVQVAVPEPEVPFVKIGQPVQVTVEELRDRIFPGSVTRYTHTLDEATKTMMTEIEIPNPKGELYPGMYASVRVELERKNDVLLLPAEALVLEKKQISVFALQDNKARKVSIKPGFNDGISVEVVEGLKPEQTVVLAGKQTLTDGQPVSAVEAK